MFTQAKLILQSYKPLKLERGMWFLAMHHGEISVYELGYDVHNDHQIETYVQLNGYPVEPYLYVVGNPNIPDETFCIASPEEIGWFDAGEHSDELYDITIKEINNILDNNGYCQIEVREENLDDDEAQEEYINIVPVLTQNKVVIRYEYEENYDDVEHIEEEQEEEEEYEPPMCGMCNGSGEGMWDGSSCSFCKGSGVIIEDNRDEPDDWDHHSHYDY